MFGCEAHLGGVEEEHIKREKKEDCAYYIKILSYSTHTQKISQ